MDLLNKDFKTTILKLYKERDGVEKVKKTMYGKIGNIKDKNSKNMPKINSEAEKHDQKKKF